MRKETLLHGSYADYIKEYAASQSGRGNQVRLRGPRQLKHIPVSHCSPSLTLATHFHGGPCKCLPEGSVTHGHCPRTSADQQGGQRMSKTHHRRPPNGTPLGYTMGHHLIEHPIRHHGRPLNGTPYIQDTPWDWNTLYAIRHTMGDHLIEHPMGHHLMEHLIHSGIFSLQVESYSKRVDDFLSKARNGKPLGSSKSSAP